MYDEHIECERFDQWLLEGSTELESPVWREHLNNCDECSEQWVAHQMLALTFAEEPVPELSPNFEAALDRKIASAVEIRPLSGWRKAAMFGYGVAALGVLAWVLKDYRLPTIDLSSPWVPIAALVAVPLTFMLAIAASKLIPGRGLPRGLRMLSL
jgi:hypothetical protein